MAATKEQYEKILGRKLTDGEWKQIGSLHSAPASTVPPLAQLSITPHGDGVTAYRMGAMDRSIDAAKLARARAFYLGSEGPQGGMEAMQYGAKVAPMMTADGKPIAAPAPAAAPVAAPAAAAPAATFPAPVATTAVQDPGNMEPYVEPTYPLVKPVPQPAPVVTLAPIVETVKVKKKKAPEEKSSAFKMPMLGDAPDESPIPPPKAKG